jgi:hypothetical protein
MRRGWVASAKSTRQGGVAIRAMVSRRIPYPSAYHMSGLSRENLQWRAWLLVAGPHPKFSEEDQYGKLM